MPFRTSPRRRLQHGFTLIESIVAAIIMIIIIAAVVPSYSQTVERRRIDGLVAQFETDVRYAQSEAQMRSGSVRLSFAPHVAGSCYIVHTGRPTDCTCTGSGGASCIGAAQALRAAFVPLSDQVQISSNSRSIVFNAVRQTVTPTASVTFTGKEGRSVKQIVSVMGRVRACSPRASVSGYRAC